MSEISASRGERSRREQGIDRLLSEVGLDEAHEIRAELLELRALADVRPEPSAEVRALMAPAGAVTTPLTALPSASSVLAAARALTEQTAAPLAAAPLAADEDPSENEEPSENPAEPVDELAARRRRKRRAGIAALAVAASLAAGATAAAASDGGIPGTIEHLGAVVGSVVSKLAPGSGDNAPAPGGNAPQRQGSPSEPGSTRRATGPAEPTPSPASSEVPGSPRATPHSTSGSNGTGTQSDPRKGLQDIAKGRPVPIPSPAIPSPAITLPDSVPTELLPGNPAKP